MKYMKKIIYMILLVLIIFMTNYSHSEENINQIDKLVESFELTNVEFEFYNIKSTEYIYKQTNIEDLYKKSIQLIESMGYTEEDFEIKKYTEDDIQKINFEYGGNGFGIKINIIQKSIDESYIIVDILDNKEYKNIVDIYHKIEENAKKSSNKIDINLCISGKYGENLYLSEKNNFFNKVLYNMKAKTINKIEDKNFVSITAYSEYINDTLKVMDENINLNIGMRYNENESKTHVYIATPIIKLDY